MVCFDAWQWEAWKSAPYVHYNQGGMTGFGWERKSGGSGGGGGGGDDHAGGPEVSADPWLLTVAALFRAGTYVGATAVGIAFLAALPRAHVPALSPLGSRTVYGYLLHAPALLGLLAAGGVFERAGQGGGLDGWEAVCMGVGLPALVTAACMSRLAKVCFWWLCEPRFGAGAGGVYLYSLTHHRLFIRARLLRGIRDCLIIEYPVHKTRSTEAYT